MSILSDFFSGVKSRFSGETVEGKSAQGGYSPLVVSHSSDIKATDQLNAYEKSEWVFSACKAKADAVAAAPIRLFKQTSSGKKIEVKEHPSLSMLRKPNPILGGYDFVELISLFDDLVGEAFFWFDTTLEEICPLSPPLVEIEKDDKKYIKSYKYRQGANVTTYDPASVLHFKENNPSNMYRGISPLKAAGATVDSDIFANFWNRNFFENSAIPDGFLKTPKNLSDRQYKRLMKEWNKKYKGVSKSHKLAILEAGLEYQEAMRSHRDMEFVTLGDKSRDKILAVFRVPKFIVGILDDVNYASARAAEYWFSKNTTLPRLRKFANILTEDFLRVGWDGMENYFFEFDDPTPEIKEESLKEEEADFKHGAITPNEIRAKRGRAPVEGGDEVYIPMNMIPLSQASALFTPEKEEEKPKEDKKKKPKKEKKSLKILAKKIITEAYLKRFERKENIFALKVKGLLQKQERIVLENIKKFVPKEDAQKSVKKGKDDVDVKDLLFNREEWRSKYITFSVPIITDMFSTEGESAMEEIGSSLSFEVGSPKVAREVARQAVRFADDVNDTTIKRVVSALEKGIEAGEGQNGLSGRVKTVFKSAKVHRTKTIARTETLRASNKAHVMAYDQAGVEKKEWVSVHDSRTRHAHEEADGQVVKMEDDFEVGGEPLEHPGDLKGSGENTINCRCRTIAVVDE